MVPVGIDIGPDVAGAVETELAPAVDAATAAFADSVDVAAALEAFPVAVYVHPARGFAAADLGVLPLMSARWQFPTRFHQHLVHLSLLAY